MSTIRGTLSIVSAHPLHDGVADLERRRVRGTDPRLTHSPDGQVTRGTPINGLQVDVPSREIKLGTEAYSKSPERGPLETAGVKTVHPSAEVTQPTTPESRNKGIDVNSETGIYSLKGRRL